MTQEGHVPQSPLSEWSLFLPWEEDEILNTYIIPRVEAVRRAPQWLWHEGRCYFGIAPRDEESDSTT